MVFSDMLFVGCGVAYLGHDIPFVGDFLHYDTVFFL